MTDVITDIREQAIANALLATGVPLGNTIISDGGQILWDSVGYQEPIVTEEMIDEHELLLLEEPEEVISVLDELVEQVQLLELLILGGM